MTMRSSTARSVTARRLAAWFSMALVAAMGGCGGAAPAVLGDEWPAQAPEYEDAYEKWTRHDWKRRDTDMVIDAWATLKTPEWRAAYVAEYSARAGLSEAQRAQLLAAHRKEASELWEIELVVATHDYAVNDFDREEHSVWKLTLANERGEEVAPLDVKEDRRPKSEIRAWFPEMSPFHRAYRIKFPKIPATELRMNIGGALGRVEFRWGHTPR